MIRMTKAVNGQLLFWEVWQEFNKQVFIQKGIVGSTGEKEEMRVKLFQRAEKVMKDLADEKTLQGYEYHKEQDLFELIVRYEYEENQEWEETLEVKDEVEYILNEGLGNTGNGACFEGSLEAGRVSIVNYVVDVEKAITTINEELKKTASIEGVELSFFLVEDGEYISLDQKGRTAK
ncbi:hypothetical protein FZC79_17975 [Rossellomorea vietnamensis]|uniref:WGR domain-containing protein n=1 Tax=Rossellomorea vietnamensis TaxID=218284 RepID=A0A5D4K9I5_9BACI|nr:hypothetical protein [Rossellomorea vietnamensis]TYR73529.1 hypothetical protein FZC79_17975 [Rossellomorea vietnamensis]